MKSCAVIGAPPSQFKFKYNEKHTACKRLKRVMQKQFILLYQQGVHDFYIGSSLGTEIWAGEILLRLKEDPAFSAIQLHVLLPYSGHDAAWDARSRLRLSFILCHAFEQIPLSQNADGYRLMPTKLLEHADLLLAVCSTQQSPVGSVGTALLRAQDRRSPVIAVDPDTAEISHLKDGSLISEIV